MSNKSTQELRSIIDRLHELQESDNMDNSQLSKLSALARDGLVPDDQVNQVRTAMIAMMNDRQLSAQQRQVLLDVLGTLADIITSDVSIYQRLKSNIRQNSKSSESGDTALGQ